MHILLTGAKSFLGRNLRHSLPVLRPEDTLELLEADGAEEEWTQAALRAEFVFHLEDGEEQTKRLLTLLEDGAKPPVWYPGGSMAEAVRAYGERTGAQTFLYDFPEVFGKWSQPFQNSEVATFCCSLARGLPVAIDQPSARLRLAYIDDVVNECLNALNGCAAQEEDGLRRVEPVYDISRGELVERLTAFRDMRDRFDTPDQSDPLNARLYATYLSFVPEYDLARRGNTHADYRGSVTELIHMGGHGQVSVNVIKPHIVKGEHWHHTKHKKYIVLSGEGVIRFRKPDESTVITYRVSGDVFNVVDIPPGYTHNIENTGESDLIVLVWVNEIYDPARFDAFPMQVEAVKENGSHDS